MDLEDQHHLDIDAVYSTGTSTGGDLYITLECRWCPCIAEIDVPVSLADLNQRGDEHMDTCTKGRP